MKTNFPTINSWTTQSSIYSHKTWGGVWVVIAISSIILSTKFQLFSQISLVAHVSSTYKMIISEIAFISANSEVYICHNPLSKVFYKIVITFCGIGPLVDIFILYEAKFSGSLSTTCSIRNMSKVNSLNFICKSIKKLEHNQLERRDLIGHFA